MKKFSLLVVTVCAAAAFAGCGAPAANTNTANANTSGGPVGPPTVEGLKALETRAFEAYRNKDGRFFEGFLTDKFAMSQNGMRLDKAATVKWIAEHKCDVKSFSFTDEKLTKVGPVTAIITMKVTTDGTCDGQKIPSPSISATLFVRNGTEWKGAWHGEIPVVDLTAPPALARADEKKAPASTTKADDKSAPDAKPAANAETAALAAVEQSLWEAWRVRDSKKMDEMIARELAFVNIFGGYFQTRADALKDWAENKCEVESITYADSSSISVTDDTSVFFHKATADGTCFGQKIGPIFGTSVYVKDGTAWKLAFTMNMPGA